MAWEIPIHKSLCQPILTGGVPRDFAYANAFINLAIAASTFKWILAAVMFLVLHGVSVYMTKRDPAWLDVLKRHVKHAKYYRSI